MRAQADVCFLIAKESKAFIADLSQNCDRATVCPNHLLPVLTTSSILYNYETGGFLDKPGCLKVLGFDPNTIDFEFLTHPECRNLAGNGMRLPALVKLYIPLFKFLGQLAPAQAS